MLGWEVAGAQSDECDALIDRKRVQLQIIIDVYLPFDLGLLVQLDEYLMRRSIEQARTFHLTFQTTVDVVECNVIPPTFEERYIPFVTTGIPLLIHWDRFWFW